jgi:hypothetical protein
MTVQSHSILKHHRASGQHLNERDRCYATRRVSLRLSMVSNVSSFLIVKRELEA